MDNDIKDILMKLLEGQNRLETEVKKSSFRLENIEKNIYLIAEVQTAHKEQNERCFEKILQNQGSTNTLITSSIKSVSDDIIVVKKDIK